MRSDPSFSAGDRVLIVGAHPWNSYAGRIIGEWPANDLDWLIELDNGIQVGAKSGDLAAAE